jgi:hypothetical protein
MMRREFLTFSAVGAVCCLIGKALNAVSFGRTIPDWLSTATERRGRGTSILDLSELISVPGNIGLSECHKLPRSGDIAALYDRIATELDRRQEAARPTALISVHSFTPVFKTVARLWHVGVLYNRDPRFAQIWSSCIVRKVSSSAPTNRIASPTRRIIRSPSMATSGTCTMWHSKFAKTSSRRKRVSDVGGVVCAIVRTLDADHEHNCCIPSGCSP